MDVLIIIGIINASRLLDVDTDVFGDKSRTPRTSAAFLKIFISLTFVATAKLKDVRWLLFC